MVAYQCWVGRWVRLRRALHQLSARAIARAKPPGFLHDGGGLYLQITDTDARSWVYRFALGSRRREMGLGAYPAVTLAAARMAATNARALVAGGQDPIAARDAGRAAQRLQEARGVTWDQAVEQFLAAHEKTWRNPKHRQQWRNTLATYAAPVLGGLSVAAIDTPEVTKVLDSIWYEKPETASRVRGRIERVLDWSKVRGLRTGENPARWRGHLDKVFPSKTKVRKVRHHPAVPIDNLPAVYARLKASDGMGAKAARYVILTAARPSEGSHSRWPEIDRQGALWTVPAARMKAEKDHRAPLSAEALSILDDLVELRTRRNGYIFPGGRAGRPISLTSLTKALRAAGGGKATVHGTARSTFKDWASERTSFPGEVSEMALAHTIDDKVEAAYRRGELLEKRRAMAEQWATFLCTPPGASVVPIGKRARVAGRR
jgi:integrase